MKITKEMTNGEIYQEADRLLTAFPGDEDKAFPVKSLFLLRKNTKNFIEAAQDIEKLRMEVIQKYGKVDPEDETKYSFSPDVIEKANSELTDLIDLKQEITYYTFPLEALGDIEITGAQMDAIEMFIDYEE